MVQSCYFQLDGTNACVKIMPSSSQPTDGFYPIGKAKAITCPRNEDSLKNFESCQTLQLLEKVV